MDDRLSSLEIVIVSIDPLLAGLVSKVIEYFDVEPKILLLCK